MRKHVITNIWIVQNIEESFTFYYLLIIYIFKRILIIYYAKEDTVQNFTFFFLLEYQALQNKMSLETKQDIPLYANEIKTSWIKNAFEY